LTATGLAIAIVTHNSLSDLRECLNGQLAAARALGCPFIAVDNASTDGGPGFLNERLDRSRGERCVAMSKNAGYAAAVNAALRETPGRDLMLLNPDVELTAGARGIAALQHVLELHPRVAVAAPRLVDSEGRPQPSARRFPSAWTLLGSTPVGRMVPALRQAYVRYSAEPPSETHVVDWAIGAALLVRRAANDDVGGWDARYFLYVEDLDFCRRCQKRGWHVAYVPHVEFRHRYDRASSQRGASAFRSRSRRHHIQGFWRFWSKNPSLFVGRGAAPPRPLEAEPTDRF
jgi:N-acetylglucosaminyl-diphospho-decaprenol L-rhamnosyltransferase